MSDTSGFIMSQTMLRIKDPEKSVPFYKDVLGMELLSKFDFPEMQFSLYFMGYNEEPIPEDDLDRAKWVFEQPALLELTYNYGTESDDAFVYHNGNDDRCNEHHVPARGRLDQTLVLDAAGARSAAGPAMTHAPAPLVPTHAPPSTSPIRVCCATTSSSSTFRSPSWPSTS